MIDDLLRWLWGEAYSAHCVEVASEPFRAAIWIVANLSVALAYFGIPREIGFWADAMSLKMSGLVARMFQALIFMCGISHLAMVAVMPTTNWFFIVAIFIPLSAVSVSVYFALRIYRARIVSILKMARILLASAKKANHDS